MLDKITYEPIVKRFLLHFQDDFGGLLANRRFVQAPVALENLK